MVDPASAQTPRIHIPAATEHIATARAFVGALARHFGCSEETVEDLRLAVTEACAQALDEGVAARGFEVRFGFDAGTLTLEMEPAARFVAPEDRTEPLDPTAGDRRRALIVALFPAAELPDPDGGEQRIRITTPCGGHTPETA